MTRLLFLTGDDPFSAAVKAWTLSPASHVALALGNSGNLLLHAVAKGIILEPRWAVYRRLRYRDVAEFEVLPDVSRETNALLARAGDRYDYGEIVSHVLLRVARCALPWIPATVSTPRRWTCARFLLDLDPTRSKIPEWRGLDARTVTPSDLLRVAGSSFRRL